jgi:biotin operon repressor
MPRPGLTFPADLADLSDSEIANRLGVARARVRRARRRAGLAPLPSGRRAAPEQTAPEQVAALVLASAGPVRVRDLQRLPFAVNTIRHALTELVGAGRIDRVGVGLYAPPQPVEEPGAAGALPIPPAQSLRGRILALLARSDGVPGSVIVRRLGAKRASALSALNALRVRGFVVRKLVRGCYRWSLAPRASAAAKAAPEGGQTFAAGLAVGRLAS